MTMPDARYLLSIKELVTDVESHETCSLWEQVFEKLDEERRRKVETLRNMEKKASSAGAGLLLQWAVRQWTAGDARTAGFKTSELKTPKLETLSLSELLRGIPEPLPLRYDYGPMGKPYLRDMSLSFNLSHSGEYVLCALSEREIGADIQRREGHDMDRLARRFFHERERERLEQMETAGEREEYFYRLWTRKEAYGKLTGKGIASSVEKDFSTEDAEWMQKLCWEEYDVLPDYAVTCCTYGRVSI